MCGEQAPRTILSTIQLRSLLDDAKTAHTMWEEVNGRDPDWQTWYAIYIWNRLEKLDAERVQ